ncbi:helix-turn-helix transcriptional regulator [Terrimonas sp. NA20]|uniref:Helix-turn-helix transcriptional regulator n=1 Tax=Terrimonas ginsenosidimutans TaxID=2908004 RepID=A0ABS9KQR8_9BACT|nr:helix-turn-helix transcriptional regulator [Terrimonas ginsenosidimutans]MCG2614653.1 helix-turn-helix transcriptional regulator [Terrimonas ginsenosidimutans]
MKLHLRIVQARQEKGLTQEELAELAGVSARTIQRIESGDSVPRNFTVKAIATALDQSFEQLMREEPVPHFAQTAPVLDDQHFLRMLNLSCFSYMIIPYVHFLIPRHVLKSEPILNRETGLFARKLIREQVSWVVIFHLSLILTLAYNLIVVKMFGNRHLVVSYLWPFFIMYLVNAVIISLNAVRIKNNFKSLNTSNGLLNVG